MIPLGLFDHPCNHLPKSWKQGAIWFFRGKLFQMVGTTTAKQEQGVWGCWLFCDYPRGGNPSIPSLAEWEEPLYSRPAGTWAPSWVWLFRLKAAP